MEGWIQVTGALWQISVGSKDYVCGCDNANIFKLTGGTKPQGPWTCISTGGVLDGNSKQVSVGSDGSIWALDKSGNVYEYEEQADKSWIWVNRNANFIEISVGSSNIVYGVNSGGNIFKYPGDPSKSWVQISNNGIFNYVAVGSDGVGWALDTDGNVYRQGVGLDWNPIPEKLSQISVGSKDIVYGVDSQGNVYKYTGDTTPWVMVIDIVLNNVGIGSDGTLWGANSQGNAYYYLNNSLLQLSNGRLGEHVLDPTDTATYLYDVANTSTFLNLSNVTIELLYDKEIFNKITVFDNLQFIPSLVAGATTTVNVTIQTDGAASGPYRFYGAKTNYTVSADNASILGLFTFDVEPD